MRKGRVAAGAALLLACGIATVHLTSPTWSSFGRITSSAGNSVAAKPDWRAPAASGSVVVKTQGGTPGYVKGNGTYRVLANVTDTGNPPSGVASVTGNLTALTAGQTAAALAAGSYSAGGVSYNRGSAVLTAGGSLTEGAKTYSLATTDAAGNAGGQGGFPVIVDNTAPAAADIQTANTSGGTVGRPQAGDTITFTFSEPVEPASILAGWSGASTAVSVRITDGGGLLGLGHDGLTVRTTGGSLLPLGEVDLGRGDYRVTLLGLGGPINFAATMAMSGNSVVVTLGAADDTADTAGGNGTMTWAPASGPYDRAANALNTAGRTESGAADREF